MRKYFKDLAYAWYAGLVFFIIAIICLVMVPTWFFIGLSGIATMIDKYESVE